MYVTVSSRPHKLCTVLCTTVSSLTLLTQDLSADTAPSVPALAIQAPAPTASVNTLSGDITILRDGKPILSGDVNLIPDGKGGVTLIPKKSTTLEGDMMLIPGGSYDLKGDLTFVPNGVVTFGGTQKVEKGHVLKSGGTTQHKTFTPVYQDPSKGASSPVLKVDLDQRGRPVSEGWEKPRVPIAQTLPAPIVEVPAERGPFVETHSLSGDVKLYRDGKEILNGNVRLIPQDDGTIKLIPKEAVTLEGDMVLAPGGEYTIKGGNVFAEAGEGGAQFSGSDWISIVDPGKGFTLGKNEMSEKYTQQGFFEAGKEDRERYFSQAPQLGSGPTLPPGEVGSGPTLTLPGDKPGHKAPNGGHFPPHWGAPPEMQTMDYGTLPGGYGNGSSTLAGWIANNLKKDRENGELGSGPTPPENNLGHKAPNGNHFPKHWGNPPQIQTRDLGDLPGGYGKGSGTLARWIAENLKKDRENPQLGSGPTLPPGSTGGGELAGGKWHDGGEWKLGYRDDQEVQKLDIKSTDGGKTFEGWMQYEGEGPIRFRAVQTEDGSYIVENQWGSENSKWHYGGKWELGGRDDQKVVDISIERRDGELAGEMTYEGEGPIGFRSKQGKDGKFIVENQWGVKLPLTPEITVDPILVALPGGPIDGGGLLPPEVVVEVEIEDPIILPGIQERQPIDGGGIKPDVISVELPSGDYSDPLGLKGFSSQDAHLNKYLQRLQNQINTGLTDEQKARLFERRSQR